jgi:hypothetical protein
MAIVKIDKGEITDSTYTHRWIEDVKRIQQVLLDNGYSSLLEDCGRLWDNYSDDMCAGWMGLLEDDEELFNILKYRI